MAAPTYTISKDGTITFTVTAALGDTNPKDRLAVLKLASAAIDEAKNAESATDGQLDARVAEAQAFADRLKAARAVQVDDGGKPVPATPIKPG